MAKYTVINQFTDLQDNNFKYSVGDEYPRTGLKVDQKRIDSLLSGKNKRGIPMIKEVVEKAPEIEKVPNIPEEPSPVPEEVPVEEKTGVSRAKSVETNKKPTKSRKSNVKSNS